MNNESIHFSDEANEMHAGASEYAEREAVLAEMAREDEREDAELWLMMGIEACE